jgi:hypothetical protein
MSGNPNITVIVSILIFLPSPYYFVSKKILDPLRSRVFEQALRRDWLVS